MVTFKNIELVNFLKSKLDLDSEIFDENKLLDIDEIHLSSKNYADEYNSVDITELQYFKHLKILKLSNLIVDNDVVEILKSLVFVEEIDFDTCVLKNCCGLKDLRIERLIINNCLIDDDSFIYEMNCLKELSLISSYLNFNNLNRFIKLRYLNVASSTCIVSDNINLPVLEELILDYSNIDNLDFVLKLHNLKRLSLSKNQMNENRTIIENLMSSGVQVYENNIIKVEGVY